MAGHDETQARRDPHGLLIAVVAAVSAGFSGTNAMPFLVGSLMDGLGLDEGAVGLLGSLELLALAGSSLGFAPRVARLSRRRLALGGVLVACAGNALSAAAGSYALLLAARLLAGFGGGAAIAAGNAAAAGSSNPDRLFASMTLIAIPAAALVLAALPFVIAPWGYPGAFVLLGAFGLAWLPFLRWLPAPAPAGAAARAAPTPQRRRGLSTLGAVLLLGLGEGGLWAFTERIGLRVGLAGPEVGAALAGTTLIGLAGAGAAAWLGTRRGRARPLVAAIVALVLSVGGIGYVTSPGPYVAMLLAWGVVYFFTLPFLMGTTAALDPQGRWAAAASGAGSVGTALGPATAGVLIEIWSYPALSALVVACSVAAACLVLPVARFVDGARTRGPAAS